MTTAASSVLANWLLKRHSGVKCADAGMQVGPIVLMPFLRGRAYFLLADQVMKQGGHSVVRGMADRVALLCVFGLFLSSDLGYRLRRTYLRGATRNVTGRGD